MTLDDVIDDVVRCHFVRENSVELAKTAVHWLRCYRAKPTEIRYLVLANQTLQRLCGAIDSISEPYLYPSHRLAVANASDWVQTLLNKEQSI